MAGMKPDERIREPMLWSDEKDAGQTTWEPFFYNKDTNIGVSKQLQDPNSLLQHYKQLITWRNDLPALHNGDIASYKLDNPSLLAYQRVTSQEKVLVVHNLSKDAQTVTLPDATFSKLALTNKYEASLRGTTLELPPYSSVILK
jgi:glycosidase